MSSKHATLASMPLLNDEYHIQQAASILRSEMLDFIESKPDLLTSNGRGTEGCYTLRTRKTFDILQETPKHKRFSPR